MPALAAWLYGLISEAVKFFASAYGRRVGLVLGISVVTAGVYAAFFLAVSQILTALQLVAPDGLNTALSWFVPSAINGCIAARLSTEVLVWAVQWKNMIGHKLSLIA